MVHSRTRNVEAYIKLDREVSVNLDKVNRET